MKVDFTNVINRMKLAGNLKNASGVARVLEVTPQAISNYKKRGTFPASLVLRFADIYSVSVDWLLGGDGELYSHGFKGASNHLRAGETIKPYGELSRGEAASLADFAGLTPDELICVGKLLKILRDDDDECTKVVKHVLKAV